MAKRSITDEEIALIKAMLKRGMKNKDIQFFFNTPDRPVNSGRITGISGGTYSNSLSIAASSDTELDSFLSGFTPTGVSASVTVPSGVGMNEVYGPTHSSTLKDLFEKDSGGVWRFRHGESDKHECKESFGFRHADKWLRAVAALANNEGGYVLFGVRDKNIVGGKVAADSYQVTGLSSNEFANADPADFSSRIKSVFDPTPRVEAVVVDVEGRFVGVIYVHRHPGRPVIATKNEGNVKEGDIFFRYPGQSARIKYGDLRTLLDERDRQAREQILPMVEKLLSLGPKNAMVADLLEGQLTDQNRSILIGEDLLDRIKFIREGEFDEVTGAPTLKLIGDVQSVDETGSIVRKGFVTPSDLVEEFLNLRSPYDPKDFIRCAIEGGNGAWLPMHYYARKAGLDRTGLADFIMGTAAPEKRREMYRDRALGKTSAKHTAGGQASVFLGELKSGNLPDVKDVTDAANVGRAIAGLDAQPKASLDEMLALLRRCKAIIQESSKPSWMSAVRRGVARLDELYFSEA